MIRTLLLVFALIPTAFAQATDIPRTVDGRPDFHGVWESRWLTPFERLDGTTEATVTGEAAKAYAAARVAELFKDGGALHPEEDFDFSTLLPAGDGSYRTSLIVEPANGKRPQTQVAKDVGALGRDIRKAAENPEGLSNDERCMSATGRTPLGISPGSMYRQIVQTPGHVMIYTEDQMVTRVIGIGAAPRPVGLVSLAGDSVATWENDTLVVVTTQIRPQLAPPGAPPFDQQRRVTERFSLIDADQIDYSYVLEDSAMLTEPLRVQYNLMRTDALIFESACHEGNYSIGGMMLGARLLEQAAGKPKP
ncbi:MAG: hypothetical protein B7Y90_09005 [Alphaproteobacteria bacterium 32-64-14]|nr:MAG: hypothetical protein B7Y90_09005 [Alphaproteobacteria bacterium 32-64-14]